MKNKEVIRWIATFLSLILLIQAFPASVIAENASVSRTAEILSLIHI